MFLRYFFLPKCAVQLDGPPENTMPPATAAAEAQKCCWHCCLSTANHYKDVYHLYPRTRYFYIVTAKAIAYDLHPLRECFAWFY